MNSPVASIAVTSLASCSVREMTVPRLSATLSKFPARSDPHSHLAALDARCNKCFTTGMNA